ncbi:carboxyvinyl-carboxyphosphonate phosphorylmutase [Sphaerisporangium album]|uniref:Carboxyvinyl-carboxyphosphonate phosphorylmutase n=1 Tax=Sphaerisporangium album TaxID=509200 RepID=A0A367F6F5_9ACTN|nr:isocitrate lyase/PEP mutase family protein [Sphaerisporangium album]RCG25933.1 carboxyvinyl-carboxyphosphonate phosphorylmutase [Sphaerisporangium album]
MSTAWLRRRIAQGPPLVCPGAANALAARVIEDSGFEACYVTGAGIANTYLGAPDLGLVTLTELAGHVAAIRDAVALPLVVDADTGFGNPLGVQRAVRMLERAGADAVQIEDQVHPKRCGHFGGKEVVPVGEMVAKVRAAVDARRDLLVIARTDARAVEGFDAAIDRAARYAEAGADVTFVEAPTSVEELLAVPRRLPGVPQVANLVEGGRTPALPVDRLGDFRIVLFANLALQGAVLGMRRVLSTLRSTGSLSEAAADVAGWEERQRLVRKPAFDELEKRYES